jgi:putative sterol carrier protein
MIVTTPQDVFDDRLRGLERDPQRIAGLTARFRFELAGPAGGTWTLDVADGGARVLHEDGELPDVTLLMSCDDFLAMANGELSGQEAYMTGRFQVRGNALLAMRLQQILAA